MRRPLATSVAVAFSAGVTALAAGQVSVVYQHTPASPLNSGPFANMNSSYSTQRVADHFMVASNSTVTELKWWGFMYSPVTGTQVGVSNLSGFLVQVFQSASGLPGALVYSETIPMDDSGGNEVTETLFGTGAFAGPTFQFQAALDSPVALTGGQTYWLAINAVLMSGTVSSPVFSWMDQGSSGGGTMSDGNIAVDGLFDPVDGVWVAVNAGTGGGKAFQVFAMAAVDSDNDGLLDADEPAHATNPSMPDTDGDGLLDGTEVTLAGSGSCLIPIDADSDNDMIEDGDEVTLGYDPCNVDTDGDGMDDWLDPDPLVSMNSLDDVAEAVLDVADFAGGIDLSSFVGQNANVQAARRNSITSRLQLASTMVERGNKASALSLLTTVREQIDGLSNGKNWLSTSSDQALLLHYVNDLMTVVQDM